MGALPPERPGTAGRVIASPYAWRLARERGIDLGALPGRGPGGRILAADVIAADPVADGLPTELVPDPVPGLVTGLAAGQRAGESVVVGPVPAPPEVSEQHPAPVGVPQAAIAGTLPLAGLADLVARIAATGATLTLDDAMLRATALALQAAGIASGTGAPRLTLEPDGRSLPVADAACATVGAFRALLRADAAEALLSLRIGPASAFAPANLPLPEGIPLRLILTPHPGAERAAVLLCFDPARIDEDAAQRLLGSLAALLDHPIGVFV